MGASSRWRAADESNTASPAVAYRSQLTIEEGTVARTSRLGLEEVDDGVACPFHPHPLARGVRSHVVGNWRRSLVWSFRRS